MIGLLERHGGVLTAGAIGAFGSAERSLRALAGATPCRLEGEGGSFAEEILDGAVRHGHAEVVRAALEQIDWHPDDPRWFPMLEQALGHDSDPEGTDWTDSPYLACFRLLLERCNPNLRGRPTDRQQFGLTPLHNIVARGNLAPVERVAFGRAILDKGEDLNLRDSLLKSTPLGWASRWGQLPLVRLFLERGARSDRDGRRGLGHAAGAGQEGSLCGDRGRADSPGSSVALSRSVRLQFVNRWA